MGEGLRHVSQRDGQRSLVEEGNEKAGNLLVQLLQSRPLQMSAPNAPTNVTNKPNYHHFHPKRSEMIAHTPSSSSAAVLFLPVIGNQHGLQSFNDEKSTSLIVNKVDTHVVVVCISRLQRIAPRTHKQRPTASWMTSFKGRHSTSELAFHMQRLPDNIRKSFLRYSCSWTYKEAIAPFRN